MDNVTFKDDIVYFFINCFIINLKLYTLRSKKLGCTRFKFSFLWLF